MKYQAIGTAMMNDTKSGAQNVRSISRKTSFDELPMILRMPISFLR